MNINNIKAGILILNNINLICAINMSINMHEIASIVLFENLSYLTLLIIIIETNMLSSNAIEGLYVPVK